jgi:hypothetical protein
MKTLIGLILLAIVCLADQPLATRGEPTKIKISFDDTTLHAVLLDNPAARDFISLLPISASMEDYANTEKIFYPPKQLSSENAPNGFTPTIGDIALYAPWGNIAIFYKDFRYSNGLIKLGHIEGDIEKLRAKSGKFTIVFDLVRSDAFYE